MTRTLPSLSCLALLSACAVPSAEAQSDDAVVAEALRYFARLGECTRTDLPSPDRMHLLDAIGRSPEPALSAYRRAVLSGEAAEAGGQITGPLRGRLRCTFGSGLMSTRLSRPLRAGNVAAVHFRYHGGEGWLFFVHDGGRWQMRKEWMGAMF